MRKLFLLEDMRRQRENQCGLSSRSNAAQRIILPLFAYGGLERKSAILLSNDFTSNHLFCCIDHSGLSTLITLLPLDRVPVAP